MMTKSGIFFRMRLLFFPNLAPIGGIIKKHTIRIKMNVLAHPAKSETGVSISVPRDRNIMTKIKTERW